MDITGMQFPHCDMRVLHAPQECEYCDMHADWQKLRQVWGVNFTGHYLDNHVLCPSEVGRDIERINEWGGNRATRGRFPDPHEVENAASFLARMERELLEEENFDVDDDAPVGH